jgi:anti-anti-sigma factor
MELNVIRADDSITHVAILGRLDIEGVNQIQERFVITTTSRRRATLVDVSEVTFIASFGMGMFIGVAKALQRQGTKMVLLAPTDMVLKALEAAGINHVIPIAYAEAEALQLLA